MSSRRTDEVYLKMLMERSGAERMMMGFSMFDTSRILVREGLLSKHPGMSERELKIEIFKIFYGRDFDPATEKKITGTL